MKKNILVCGLIAGSIITIMMVISTAWAIKYGDFDHGEIYGYTTMIIAFSLIFVGIKNFRDKYNNGVINFGKAFKIGFMISLIASTMYVITWLVDYYFFLTDFAEKYSAHMLDKLKASGASSAELAKKTVEMANFAKMYKNPFFNILMTYLEILPLGLLFALVAALVLKRKTPKMIEADSAL